MTLCFSLGAYSQPVAKTNDGLRGVWIPREDAFLFRHILKNEVPSLNTEILLLKEQNSILDTVRISLLEQNALLHKSINLLKEQSAIFERNWNFERRKRKRQKLYGITLTGSLGAVIAAKQLGLF